MSFYGGKSQYGGMSTHEKSAYTPNHQPILDTKDVKENKEPVQDNTTFAQIGETTFKEGILNDFLPLYIGWITTALRYFISAFFQQRFFGNYVKNAVIIEAVNGIATEIVPLSFPTIIGLKHRIAAKRNETEKLKRISLFDMRSWIIQIAFSYVLCFVLTALLKVDKEYNTYYLLRIGLGPFFGVMVDAKNSEFYCRGRTLLTASRKVICELIGFFIEALLYGFAVAGSYKTNVPTILGYLIPNFLALIWTLMLHFNVTIMKVKLNPTVFFDMNDFKTMPKVKEFKKEFFSLSLQSAMNATFELVFNLFVAFESSKASEAENNSLFVLFNFGVLGRIAGRVYSDVIASESGFFIQKERYNRLYSLYIKYFCFFGLVTLVVMVVFYYLITTKALFLFEHNDVLVIWVTIFLYILRPVSYAYVLISIIFNQIYTVLLVILAKIITYIVTSNQKQFVRVIFQEFVGYATCLMLCLSVISKVIEAKAKQKTSKSQKVSWEEDVLIED